MAKNKKQRIKVKATIPSPNSSSFPSWLTNTSFHKWFLFAFAFLLYANTLTHDYTQDDAIVIYDNMFTTKGLEGIPGILKNDTFFGFFKTEGKANLVAGGRYRPLTLVLFAAEVSLFGQSPFVGHLGNILFYGLLGIVLYLVLLRLFQYKEQVPYPALIAFISALVFIAHPVHTEVVANIKGRDEIVTLLGSLAALLFSLKAFRQQQFIWNLLAGFIFFLALMAKENAITFLAIVPLSYFIFTDAKIGKVVMQTIPFMIGAAVFLAIRHSVLGGTFGAAPTMELMNNPFLKIEGNKWVAFSFSEQMATITYTLGKYLQLLVFPHPLTHDYYPRHVDIMTWGNWKVLLSVLLHVGLGIYALIGLFKKSTLSYAILFYLITLTIVSNVVFPIGTNMAERFIFMPSVGFSLVIGLLFTKLYQSKKVSPSILLGAIGLLTILFSIKTITRNFVWKDNFTLFTTDINVSQNSAKLRNSVGGDLTAKALEETDDSIRKGMLIEAVGHLKEAIKIHPTYKNAYLLKGNAHFHLDQFQEAVQSYNVALRLDPSYDEAFRNLAFTNRELGQYYGEKVGDLPKAIQYLNQALQAIPEDFETNRLLGVAYGISRQDAKAIEFFTKCTQVQPNNADAWLNLSNAYGNSGDMDKRIEYQRKAQSIDPNVGRPE